MDADGNGAAFPIWTFLPSLRPTQGLLLRLPDCVVEAGVVKTGTQKYKRQHLEWPQCHLPVFFGSDLQQLLCHITEIKNVVFVEDIQNFVVPLCFSLRTTAASR